MALDPKLTEARAALLREIETVRKSQPAVEQLVAEAMDELTTAIERFREAPFTGPPPGEIASPLTVRLRALGERGYYHEAETRRLLEADIRRRAAASTVLRLAPAERDAKLQELRAQLRQIEARLEQARRDDEKRDPDNMQDRAGHDPDVWLRIDTELAAIARGKEPSAAGD